MEAEASALLQGPCESSLQSRAADRSRRALATYTIACRLSLAAIVCFAGIFLILPQSVGRQIVEPLTLWFGANQDIPLLWVFVLVMLIPPRRAGDHRLADIQTTFPALVVSTLSIFVVGWIGSRVVFHGYLLSRDEQMAVFDQQIFAHGRLMWPVSREWRPFGDALNRTFLLPIGANEFWISAYLPVHAAFRALLDSLGISELSSPLLAAASAAALWVVARRLWPDSRRTSLVALLLLTTSSQLLVTSMTAYSMSMHLALNLLWLALFLVDKPKTHLLAALVGFLATGIHQPLFHPLFVLPFLLLLLQQRRWRLLLFYVATYLAISAFWLAWPIWMASYGTAITVQCSSGACPDSIGYFDRLRGTVDAMDLRHLWLTASNLLRFVCWQHPLLVPLALAGVMTCWRSEPLVRAITIGFLLPIVVMALILPYQGHGWGYRYLEPVLGNAVLLACYGFRSLEKRGLALRTPLIISSAAALLLVPAHALMAARFAEPFARVHSDIVAVPADVVIVDTQLVPFGQDLVLNRFDLSNRPKLMIATRLGKEELRALCRSSTIAFYDPRRMASIARLFGTESPRGPSLQAVQLHNLAVNFKCTLADGQVAHPLVTSS